MNVKKYNVIYADPPWSYSQKSAGRGNKSGARDKYKTSHIQVLKDMPINQITDATAVLFMWGTVPLLPDAVDLLKSWGFKYKTKITWEKTGLLGMGNWLRVQEEYILVGVKGKVKPFGHQEKNIYKHPVCEHSAKPHFFRELVAKLASKSFDKCEKLELFARSRDDLFPDYEYDGWDVFGDQVNGSIELPDVQECVASKAEQGTNVDNQKNNHE